MVKIEAEYAKSWFMSQASQIIRALRVHVNSDKSYLESTLASCLDQLVPYGCVVVACYSPWETAIVRRLLREHEPPSARVMAGAIPGDKLAELYPWVTRRSHNQAPHWSVVRRVSSIKQRGQDQASSTLAVHVLQKVPHDHEPSAPRPLCGVAAAAEDDAAAGDNGTAADDTAAEIEKLQQLISARKAELARNHESLSVKQRKRDPVLRELFHRQDKLYGAKLVHKRYERAVNREHVSVQLAEAVKCLMASGGDGLYLDCTFGRGDFILVLIVVYISRELSGSVGSVAECHCNVQVATPASF